MPIRKNPLYSTSLSPAQVRLRKRTFLAAMAAPPPAPAAKPALAIRDVTARAVRQPEDGNTYVIVTISADGGLTGLGETSALPDPETAIGQVLKQKPNLTGQDALAAETVRFNLEAHNAPAAVRAAVNMALLDILGKVAKAPTYEALGGPTRNKARALAHLHGANQDQLNASLARARAAGYRAAVTSPPVADGPTKGRAFYTNTRQRLEALQKAGGDEFDFVVDCGGQFATGEIESLAAHLEDLLPLWIDEPYGDLSRGGRNITLESATPVGLGRALESKDPFQDLLRDDAVDILRPNVALLGVAEIRKAAALAESYYVAVAPFHRGGPIATAAALHVAASIPNFFTQEIPFPAGDRDIRMREELAGPIERVTDGFLALPTSPGLGVSLNEDAVRRYEVRS